MRFFLCIVFGIICTACSLEKKPQIFGSTHYHSSDSKSLKTNLNLEQRHLVYQPSHQRYIVTVGSKLVIDVDHFGNEININPCTTLGIEF
jgi:hypothetical protein